MRTGRAPPSAPPALTIIPPDCPAPLSARKPTDHRPLYLHLRPTSRSRGMSPHIPPCSCSALRHEAPAPWAVHLPRVPGAVALHAVATALVSSAPSAGRAHGDAGHACAAEVEAPLGVAAAPPKARRLRRRLRLCHAHGHPTPTKHHRISPPFTPAYAAATTTRHKHQQ